MSVTQRLVFDPASTGQGSNVGAYVRAGSDGDLIASQTISSEEWLNVAAALHDGSGNAITSTGGFLDVGVKSASFAYDEDSVFTNADEGVHNLLVIQSTLASSAADGDYGSMKGTLKGELYVHDADAIALLTTIDTDTGTIAGDTTSIDSTLTALSKAEDSVHSSGDQGIMPLAVRNDAGTALAADGDYIPLSTDSSGALRVQSNVAVDVDDSLANTAIENTATAVSTTAVAIVTSALASRKWLYLANEGNKSLYFGKSGVTTVNGFPLHPGMQLESRIGPSVAPEIIGETGASSEDLRVMELS